METAHGLSDAEASELLARMGKIAARVAGIRGGHEDADEVTAEVILRIQTALLAGNAQMRAHRSDSAYLSGMARNVCRERERRRGVEKRARERLDSIVPQGGVAAATRLPTQQAPHGEPASALREVIGPLTPGQRAVALLRAADYAPADIQRLLGRSRWSVRSALQALRRGLTERRGAAEGALPRPTEPLAPPAFFLRRRSGWERPWSLHLAGANHTDIAQALKVSKPAARRRIQRIRLAIQSALRRSRRVPARG